MTRTAISPRFATSTVRIGLTCGTRPGACPRWARGGSPPGRGPAPCASPGVDDAVVPQARGAVVGVALLLVLGEDGADERVLLLRGEGLPLPPQLVPLHREEHRGRLLAAHDADAGVRPHPQEPRVVGPAAHGVVAGAVGAADDDREAGHPAGADRVDHLGPRAGDAGGLVLP